MRLLNLILLCVLFLAWLPLSGGASPLTLTWAPGKPTLETDSGERLSQSLQRLSTAWKSGEADSLWSLLDRGRGQMLWKALSSDTCRYSPIFDGLGEGSYREWQETLWREGKKLSFAMSDTPSLAEKKSLFESRSHFSTLVSLGSFDPFTVWGNEEKHSDHPFLDRVLVLSVLSPLSPPKDFALKEEPRSSCSLIPGLPAFSLGNGESRDQVSSRLDSLLRDHPRLKKVGWLKRILIRKSLRKAALELRDREMIWQKYRERQSRGETCLPGRSVLRLVYLREGSVTAKWRLSMILHTGINDGSALDLSREPGYREFRDSLKL